MLEIKNLSMKVNNKYMIKDLSFILNKNDKLAVIGEEGNGKSTLLKAILGIANYAEVEGTINSKKNRLGYLEQSLTEETLEKTGYEYLFTSDEDYYNKVNNFYKQLDRLNLQDDILDRKLKTLSGGEKVKIRMIKLLLEEYDILLLDEPTNDLDIETLEWLENFINKVEQPIIYVSHDEVLLSHTANMILHIEQIKHKTECRHTLTRIDYDSYVEIRLNKLTKQTQIAKSEKRKYEEHQEKLKQVMQKVEYQQNTISRSDPHGARLLKKKMHSLKSQEKKLDNKELTELPDVEESINFSFEEVDIPKSKTIISIILKELKVQNKILSKNIELEIIGNPHVCIIGQNGVGKTTLIKELYNTLKTRIDIKVGYMPQNYEDILKEYDKVIDFIAPSGKKEEITKARMYLGNMNFTREEMEGKVEELSNGTKAKLILMKLVLDKCNVLLLDEPTRNVSPLSNPVIRKVLKEFKGTIISVSHDRKYIEEVIDKLYRLTPNGLTVEKLWYTNDIVRRNKDEKKILKQHQAIFPMPVLMIEAYNEDKTVDIMNAAWGMMLEKD